jgi:hypothetical protein
MLALFNISRFSDLIVDWTTTIGYCVNIATVRNSTPSKIERRFLVYKKYNVLEEYKFYLWHIDKFFD